MTSCFARLKTIPQDLRPVAISVGVPSWFKGPRELRLAPTWQMLQLEPAEYDRLYRRILDGLDPKQLFQSLGGDRAVLLCWEVPGVKCHRRLAAEWIEQQLGIVVPEFGFGRGDCPAYEAMPDGPPKKRRALKAATPTLFPE